MVPAGSSDPTTCAVTGCEKRINQKCARHACAGHCRIQGLKLNGDKALCSLVAHAPKNSEAQALPIALPSQSSASTWGTGHPFIPTTRPDPSTSLIDTADYTTKAFSSYGPPPPTPPRPTQPIASRPRLEPPASMDPLPNPRYSSQIRVYDLSLLRNSPRSRNCYELGRFKMLRGSMQLIERSTKLLFAPGFQ